MRKLVLATNNQNKLREVREILMPLGIEVLSQQDAGVSVDPEENGTTFAANAEIKARAVYEEVKLPVIADDSGLCVDALDGAPGVYSARFAGEDGNDEKNNEKLLNLLSDLPYKERRAKFVSVITMVFPDGESITARGECPGHIIDAPVGENGFGYDPLFVPDGFQRTFAQLSPEEKNEISHRANALVELERLLKERK